MAPSYKLRYFNSRGRAEHIRFIFAYAEVEYEDERISREKWPEIKKEVKEGFGNQINLCPDRGLNPGPPAQKSDTLPPRPPGLPFGVLPVLEVDGKVVGQSVAIARYLAKEFGLAGKDAWESLQCDMLVDTLSDLRQVLSAFRSEPDPVKKEEKKHILIKETIPYYLKKFENVLNENNGFFVGGAVTWTDLVFAVSLEGFEAIFGKEALDSYPTLKSFKERIFNFPNIRAWIEKRPVTEH
uniref:glutathione transferase n=1 Tax=Timema douglasi TaxID=61478 RepID=A0A7R8VFV0_TIMDO|nr:unnamed protein product [Timema douglasi]